MKPVRLADRRLLGRNLRSFAAIVLAVVFTAALVASFAWRWLAFGCFFGCMAATAALDCLIRSETRSGRVLIWGLRVAIATVLAVNLWLAGYSTIAQALAHPPMEPRANYVEAGFTPKDSARPEDLPHEGPQAELSPADGSVSVVEWAATRRIAVDAASPSVLKIRSYSFPGWSAVVDGKPAQIVSDERGLQTIPLAEGSHTVELRFETTLPRFTGLLISGIVLMLMLGVFAVSLRSRYRRLARIRGGKST